MPETSVGYDPFEGMDPQFAQQLQQLIAASGGRLYIESGYRSEEKQVALFNDALKKYGSVEAARKWVALPESMGGKGSNHTHGVAADLGGDLELAHQLAPQFGLVFPMDYEDWHIESAGARDKTDDTAYSTPPPGAQSPKEKDWGGDPSKVAAMLSESLLGLAIGDLSMSAMTTNVADQADKTTTGAPSGTTTGDVSPEQLYQTLRAQGLDPVTAAKFVSIAGRESGFSTGAHNDNRSTGDNSYGLFQINLLDGGWTDFLKSHGFTDPATELTTLEGSAKAVAAIYGNSGFNPWGPYKGMSPLYDTDPNVGASASGGEVTVAQLGT